MKNTKKKVTKKSKPAEKKPHVPKFELHKKIQQQQELYRVDMEQPSVNQKTGVTEYLYISGPAQEEVIARDSMEQLKAMGMGGRLSRLDGSPDGEVVERWAGVGRVLEASTIEKEALEQGKK